MVLEARNFDTADDDSLVISAQEETKKTKHMTVDDTLLARKYHLSTAEGETDDEENVARFISKTPPNQHNGAVQNGVDSSHEVPKFYRLNAEEQGWVRELRSRLADRLPPTYDTDFNLYRWIKSADRTSRRHGDVETAEKMLANHLRYRKAMKLDDSPVPTWDENPVFIKRILPRGHLHYMPSNNRFLWWVDYSSIDMAGIMNTVTSTEMLVYHFWKYEQMLRVINEKEKETGAMSGVHMIMDVKDYSMNPFSVLLTTNGQMNYYAQLIHYEHYPEVTCPVHIINVAKWLMLPYRIIRAVMPKDFTERIRVSGSSYKEELLVDIDPADLPEPLGGSNPHSARLQTVPGAKFDPADYYERKKAFLDPPAEQLSLVQVSARKRKLIPMECKSGATLRWWFSTDADVQFGIFFTPPHMDALKLTKKNKKDLLDKMEMVHPYFRMVTKLIPEKGEHKCERDGTYFFVFCNHNSWIYRRNVQLKIAVDDVPCDRKCVLARTYSVQ